MVSVQMMGIKCEYYLKVPSLCALQNARDHEGNFFQTIWCQQIKNSVFSFCYLMISVHSAKQCLISKVWCSNVQCSHWANVHWQSWQSICQAHGGAAHKQGACGIISQYLMFKGSNVQCLPFNITDVKMMFNVHIQLMCTDHLSTKHMLL